MGPQGRQPDATHCSPIVPLLATLILSAALLMGAADSAAAQCSESSGALVELDDFPVSTSSANKPQSKLWQHDGFWFAVMADDSGTWLRRLDGASWTKELRLSSSSTAQADAVRDRDVTHVLLFDEGDSELASVEYDGHGDYVPWSTRPDASPVPLGSVDETATIALDSTGRLWVAGDASSSVEVWYADSPYDSWSDSRTVASGITDDDICAIATLSGGKIGVMWSDQGDEQFGFKTHSDGASASSWSGDEEPGAAYAQSAGNGMADDHINLAVGDDGTLYAAVKTSYDSSSYPRLILLVRDPDGSWDAPYEISDSGTRPIVVIDADEDRLLVAYNKAEGYDDLEYRESSLGGIDFGSSELLLDGDVINVTSTKEPVTGGAVFLAAGATDASSVTFAGLSWSSTPDLVGHWPFEESGDPLQDASSYGNDAWLEGAASTVPGVLGTALEFAGGYVTVADDPSLTMCEAITLAAWIRPADAQSANIIHKAEKNEEDGYELTLSSSGTAYVRFNQVSSGNDYRVETLTDYPDDGVTWQHIAATYDGEMIRMYVNGVPEDSLSASFTIEANSLPLGIGADSNGSKDFEGALDEVAVYGYACTAAEVAAMAAVATGVPPIAALQRIVAAPNPFRARTHFVVPAPYDRETVRIYNVHGRLVRELVPARGSNGAVWDGRDTRGARVAAGTYLYRVGTTEAVTAGKVVLLR
ncbi:hypothetical protein K8I85_17120 [bacterium]|nr:hypothetical protein [bacterium]